MKISRMIFFISGKDYYSVVCNDLALSSECIVCKEDFLPEHSNPLLRFIRRWHVSRKLNCTIILPYLGIWYPKLPDVPEDKNGIAVFYQSFSGACDLLFRRYLRKKHNIHKTVFILTNPIRKSFGISSPEELKHQFDLILSDDKKDCEEYGFQYWEDNYSRIEIANDETIQSNVFFVGSSKGRLQTLHETYEILYNAGLKLLFYITDVPESDKRYPGIYYNQKLSYREVVKRVYGCDTILEVIQEEQQGLTLRTQEALTYGKKLLTNNFFIKDKAYYSSENIHLFTTPKKIDLAWVQKLHNANYSEKPDFSALTLLTFLKQYFSTVNEKDLK